MFPEMKYSAPGEIELDHTRNTKHTRIIIRKIMLYAFDAFYGLKTSDRMIPDREAECSAIRSIQMDLFYLYCAKPG